MNYDVEEKVLCMLKTYRRLEQLGKIYEQTEKSDEQLTILEVRWQFFEEGSLPTDRDFWKRLGILEK